MTFTPSYVPLDKSGDLEHRARIARDCLRDCDLCPRYCRVDRLQGIQGAVCRTGEDAIVHGYGPHFGEEDPLRGINGSGTIFFSWCNLRCVYCQNWDISHKGEGETVSAERLAAIMLLLQAQGCHNINFVSPSHVVAQIVAALAIAARRGLRLPLVYNTGGYDSPEALALLDGVIDIYMPDMKYGSSDVAHRYSRIKDYVEVNRAAVTEMHRQVGDLQLDGFGIAQRGLLVRHLVLPHGQAGTEEIFRFIADSLSTETYVNVMDQYRPCYHADRYPELTRRITREEYLQALRSAEAHGLHRLDHRRSWF